MTTDEKVKMILREIEGRSFNVYSDESYISDLKDLLRALKKNPLDFTNIDFCSMCPDKDWFPKFECDMRCDRDYRLQCECWREALKDD